MAGPVAGAVVERRLARVVSAEQGACTAEAEAEAEAKVVLATVVPGTLVATAS